MLCGTLTSLSCANERADLNAQQLVSRFPSRGVLRVAQVRGELGKMRGDSTTEILVPQIPDIQPRVQLKSCNKGSMFVDPSSLCQMAVVSLVVLSY